MNLGFHLVRRTSASRPMAVIAPFAAVLLAVG
jgi:hypothetical protein